MRKLRAPERSAQRPTAGPQPLGSILREAIPSASAARCQGFWARAVPGAGAVSARNCSSAAAIAAASSGEALGARISIRGLGGLCLPLRPGTPRLYFPFFFFFFFFLHFFFFLAAAALPFFFFAFLHFFFGDGAGEPG